ncbi:FtsQ-type POTRA domain-containing protein [candidate division WWE3 bacterium]|nr:FtsQ-type POTRA domain-containing protein [candidate division WWE3 bacterium]
MNWLPYFQQKRKNIKKRRTNSDQTYAWWRSKSFSGGIVTGILLISLFVLIKSEVLLVKRIDVNITNSRFIKNQDINIYLAPYIRESIFSIRTHQIELDLLKKFPQLQTINVTKVLPDTIQVTGKEYDIDVVLKVGDVPYVVSPQGYIFGQLQPDEIANVAIIEFKQLDLFKDTQQIVGQSVPQSTQDDIQQILSYDWSALQIKVKSIFVFNQYYELICNSRLGNNGGSGESSFVLRIGVKNSVTELFKRMEVILSSAEKDNRRLELLDLRFQAPVVRFK